MGQDLLFPSTARACCPDLVTESALELTYKNFTPIVHLMMHKSGSLQSVQNTVLDNANWYTTTFHPKMKNYHKGPLVQTIQRYVLVFEITGVLLILLLVSGKAVSMTQQTTLTS